MKISPQILSCQDLTPLVCDPSCVTPLVTPLALVVTPLVVPPLVGFAPFQVSEENRMTRYEFSRQPTPRPRKSFPRLNIKLLLPSRLILFKLN